MARDVCIDLGIFSISSYLDTNFALVVRTCASLSLPNDHPGIPSAAELRDQVRSGSIWVTRAASCQFELSVDFQCPFADRVQEDLEDVVIQAVESLPAWHALGLDLIREYNRFQHLPGSKVSYHYSVHHTRQNSGLVSPCHVQRVYLSTVSCSLSFGTRKALEDRIQVGAAAKPKKTRIVTLRLPAHRLRSFLATKIRENEAEDQLVEPTKHFGIVCRKNPPRRARRVPKDEPEIYDLGSDLREKRLEHLTHVALNLLLGLRKRFVDIDVVRQSDFPTLLEIAPAVWNARYFQEVASRTQLAPLISSALGNLTNSKSTRLRQKVQNLASDPTAELHKKTLLLILRSTPARIPKVHQRSGTRDNDHPQDAFDVAILNARAHGSCRPHKSGSLNSSQGSSSSHISLSDVGTDRDAPVFMPEILQDDSLLYDNILAHHEELHPRRDLQLVEQGPTPAARNYYISNQFSQNSTHHLSQFDTDTLLGDRCEDLAPQGMSIHWEEMNPQQSSGLNHMSMESADGTVMYSFQEPLEALQNHFVAEEFYNDDLINDDLINDDLITAEEPHVNITCDAHHDEMYLEAEKERANLLAREPPVPEPFAIPHFGDSDDSQFQSTAERELGYFQTPRYSFPESESTRLRDDGIMAFTTAIDGNDIMDCTSDADDSDHRIHSMSAWSSQIAFDGDVDFMDTDQDNIQRDEDCLGDPHEDNNQEIGCDKGKTEGDV